MNLAPHAEKVARHLLGQPNLALSSKDAAGSWLELRFGAKGSLSVPVSGAKAGTYYDFERDSGGTLFDLIRREKGFANGDALRWLADELGIRDTAGARYRITGRWAYEDENRAKLYRVVRRDAPGKPKKIHQERFDTATNTWIKGKGALKGVRRVLYRLPELLGASGRVLIAEGEAKADKLVELGWQATCCVGGAGKFTKDYASAFAGCDVVLLPDNDEPGRRHVRQVAALLEPIARSVRVLELPDLSEHGDIIDWCAAGGTAEQLRELVDQAGPAADAIATWSSETPDDDEQEGEKEARRSIVTRLVEIARANAELFITPADVGYASFEVAGHRETWPLRSRGFRYWLGRQLYEDMSGKLTAGAQAINDALVTLEGIARYDGEVRNVHLRVAELAGRYYLDLADAAWRAVEIAPRRWRMVDRPPVRFRRARSTLPLPEPERGGDLSDLRQFLNVRADDDFRALVAWELAAMRPYGPYPVLDVSGEQGAAKSTTMEVLRSLVDPGDPMTRAAPKEERDLAIAVQNGHVLALDNVSKIQPWLSDALCRFSTGGGWACRQLFTDDEEVLIDAQRPIVLGGIEELAGRPDLKDRTVGVQLPKIEKGKRRDEETFWREFESARPRLLGALLSVVAAGLARMPMVKLGDLPRMADFAKWITACEPALGWKDGEFSRLYADNRRTLTELALEGDDTIRMIRTHSLLHDKHESAGSLLEKLRSLCCGNREKLKSLPANPRALGGLLRRYAPELRAVGIDVTFEKRTEHGWPITIRNIAANPSGPSDRQQARDSAGFRHDGMADGSPDGSEQPSAGPAAADGPEQTASQPSGRPSGKKANGINAPDGPDGPDVFAGTLYRCSHCNEPIDPTAPGSISLSSGGCVHSACAQEWATVHG